MTYEPEHDHDVVVERGGGFSAGLIVGIILVILIIAALLWYFGVFGFVGGGAPASTFNVNPPATLPAGGLPSGGLPSIAPAS